MNCLLDTNILSELRKGPRAHPGVRAWFDAVSADSLYTSVLVTAEIRSGIERVRPRDPVFAATLEGWLVHLLDVYGARVLPIDARVADGWGRLNARATLPVIDGLLAATALAHDLTVVTRNVADVARSGARVLNPFDNG